MIRLRAPAEVLAAVLAGDPDEHSRAALAHARGFSWDVSVDALLASYGRAIADYGSTHRRGAGRDLTARRNGRRWTKLRGVRA